MRKRYCFVGCVLLLLLGSVPVHCAQEQKEDNKVPSARKNQKMICKKYRYDALKEQLAPSCRSVERTEDQMKKWLAKMEQIYMKVFSHLPEGKEREWAVARSMFPIKIFLKQRAALEEPRKCNGFEKWIRKITKN